MLSGIYEISRKLYNSYILITKIDFTPANYYQLGLKKISVYFVMS